MARAAAAAVVVAAAVTVVAATMRAVAAAAATVLAPFHPKAGKLTRASHSLQRERAVTARTTVVGLEGEEMGVVARAAMARVAASHSLQRGRAVTARTTSGGLGRRVRRWGWWRGRQRARRW